MIYPNYKFIDLPYFKEIAAGVLKLLPPELLQQTRFTVDHYTGRYKKIPHFVEAIETLKPFEEVDAVCYIIVGPNDRLVKHTDIGYKNPIVLNIPVYNCDDTYSVFYRVDNRTKTLIAGDFGTANHLLDSYEADETEVVEKVVMSKPMLYNVSVPHNAINDTTEPRVVLSVRFKTPFDDNIFR
jgi:hypothetical protein